MLLICFGTRPEWIKIKPVIEQLEIDGTIPYKLLYIEQHKETLSVENISYDLSIINIEDKNINRLDDIVTSILNNIYYILQDNVSYVMVQGDTTTAFAVALAAFHNHIPIIHLESGLRSWDNENPYPEEFNRRCISLISDINLCPTDLNKFNLYHAQKIGNKTYVVGNTILDGLDKYRTTKKTNNVIITLHRRENWLLLNDWFIALENLANEYKDQYNFIIIRHPNFSKESYKKIFNKVKIRNPMNSHQMRELLASASCVITDSGGLQEESSFLKVPCVVCRKKTERPESLGISSKLCDEPKFLHNIFNFVISHKLPSYKCPYGDGKSAEKILNILKGLNIE